MLRATGRATFDAMWLELKDQEQPVALDVELSTELVESMRQQLVMDFSADQVSAFSSDQEVVRILSGEDQGNGQVNWTCNSVEWSKLGCSI